MTKTGDGSSSCSRAPAGPWRDPVRDGQPFREGALAELDAAVVDYVRAGKAEGRSVESLLLGVLVQVASAAARLEVDDYEALMYDAAASALQAYVL
ncbi:MAG: hypothetical protein WKG32_18420 [Gemmatimonadaceae bacterium]